MGDFRGVCGIFGKITIKSIANVAGLSLSDTIENIAIGFCGIEHCLCF
jgi:hypothetical protein